MASFKINKNLEKILWKKKHGEPLIETPTYRIYFAGAKTMLFWIRSKKKERLLKDANGIYMQRNNEVSKGRLYLSEGIQEKLRDAIAERELLGD